MRRNHRSHLAGLIAVAGMLLVAGCTATEQGASPTLLRTPTAPLSASASPTPAPTTPEPEPTPTVERNRATAKQFIIDYFEAYEEGLRTGSPEPVAGLSSRNCGKCAAAAAELEDLAVEGKRWPTVTSSAIPYASKESEDPSVLHWEIDYSVDQGDEVDRSGAVTSSWGADRFVVYMTLQHDGRRWWIDGMATGATISEK